MYRKVNERLNESSFYDKNRKKLWFIAIWSDEIEGKTNE